MPSDRPGTVFPVVAGVLSPCGACSGNFAVIPFNVAVAVFGFTTNAPAARFQLQKLKEGEWTCGWSQTAPHSNTIEPPSEPAKLLARSVADTIRSVKLDDVEKLFKTANALHPNLAVTVEHDINIELAFLDLLVTRSQNKLSTSLYTKPSDTVVYLS